MSIQFWGVRGSIASPGPQTALVGGNTACVEVVCGSQRLILDAGTGIRSLGEKLLGQGEKGPLSLLLSHLHWDHIQGLPFFLPLYRASTELTVLGACSPMSLSQALAHQMTTPLFPVPFEELPCQLLTREIRPAVPLSVGEVTVRAARLNHPGGVLGYRLDYQGRSVVYATDTEHYACVDPALRELARGADVLIYDAQYTPEEYRGDCGPSRLGWGHSTYEAAALLAQQAGVGRLFLFHHDPGRTDAQVQALESKASELFASVQAAREGLRVDLDQLANAA